MVFPRLSASMLLASLILLLYWTTSSADLSKTSREKRDLPPRTREQVKETFQLAKDLLSTVKDTSAVKKFAESAIKSLKILSKFASMAPGIAGVLFSVVNMALAFTPQEDLVLNEVKKGFAEVNRKLDSLSIQISNLNTDVKWYNYVSIYSQDERVILNAWRKFNEFIEATEEKLQLAEIFTNYYEYRGTEASVANFYHYLTTGSTSLSENLNKLLEEKFKCDIRKMADYNLYFNTLLLKGMVLNIAYRKLIGVRTSSKEAEHVQMFKNVYRDQMSAVDRCLNNTEQYMKNDVEEISKALSPDNKKAIAAEVKKKLDEKYDWYNWVVLVYSAADEANYILHDLTKIPVGTITIAVGFTRKGIDENKDAIKNIAESDNCFKQGSEYCVNVQPNLYRKDSSCVETLPPYFHDPFGDYVKTRVRDYVGATHVIYGSNFAEQPDPFIKVGCYWSGSGSEIFLHYSRRTPVCNADTCNNGGTCKRLLDSNEGLCECQDGYYGDSCEEKMDTTLAKNIDVNPETTVNSTQSRLRMVETKLVQIINTINNRCQLHPNN